MKIIKKDNFNLTNLDFTILKVNNFIFCTFFNSCELDK